MIKFVTILGHSFVSRLEQYIRYHADSNNNLNLNLSVPDGVEVSFFGVGGATTDRIIKHKLSDIRLIPDVLILEIGTNDLADPTISPHDLVENIDVILHFLKQNGVRLTVVCQILPRKNIPPYTPDFNRKVFQTNKILSKSLTHNNNAIFWQHRTLHKPMDKIFCDDGVHLNSTGQNYLYQSYRTAIFRALSLIDHM